MRTREPRGPDAGADRVDAVGVGDDRDLRAVAGLAGDVGDLHQAVGDLGHLELEQLLDQLGVAARDDDARPLGRGRDLLDDRLDALRVVVALAVDLLGLRQQRLDALAQLHERVAGVRLLDDAGDQLADAVAVLLEHHVALGLADPLEDHLLGGLGGDAAEVVGRDVALVDLVLGTASSFSGSISGVLGLAHLARLRVDRRCPRRCAPRHVELRPRGRSGMISSKTLKSPVSRSISTRAYLAAPGCFL